MHHPLRHSIYLCINSWLLRIIPILLSFVQIDRNAVQHIWKTHVIPYVIDDEISKHSTKMISDPTCLTFQQRKTERDYLFFQNSRECASYVGCIGGKQPVYTGSLCCVGNIVHEILHALGFFHEHTRLDRDKYIEVLTENIRKVWIWFSSHGNFVKQSGDTGNAPYDQVFSSNGKPTIISHHPTLEMGQRRRLTTTDSQRIRLLYNCGM
uniref:Metalloendopeptidase n=1 Tax=Neogobius melanostomus TaxID=47308 RepID=A0A8C6WLM9_9GOBI